MKLKKLKNEKSKKVKRTLTPNQAKAKRVGLITASVVVIFLIMWQFSSSSVTYEDRATAADVTYVDQLEGNTDTTPTVIPTEPTTVPTEQPTAVPTEPTPDSGEETDPVVPEEEVDLGDILATIEVSYADRSVVVAPFIAPADAVIEWSLQINGNDVGQKPLTSEGASVVFPIQPASATFTITLDGASATEVKDLS